MSYVEVYCQAVRADIANNAWDETYFSLLSLKEQMQALPGWQRFELWATPLATGSIRVLAVTNWANRAYLAAWLGTDYTVDAILRAMTPPPLAIEVEIYEGII